MSTDANCLPSEQHRVKEPPRTLRWRSSSMEIFVRAVSQGAQEGGERSNRVRRPCHEASLHENGRDAVAAFQQSWIRLRKGAAPSIYSKLMVVPCPRAERDFFQTICLDTANRFTKGISIGRSTSLIAIMQRQKKLCFSREQKKDTCVHVRKSRPPPRRRLRILII